jgi:phosphoribosylanthranilate isomerase
MATNHPVPVIKVFRPQHGLEEIGQYLEECRQRNCLPKVVLIDAFHESQMGGTGTRANWQAIATGRKMLAGLPLVLAGGLTPDNVATAIATVAPHAVDTASGVESAPGKKDGELVQQFVAVAQVAFEKQNPSH